MSDSSQNTTRRMVPKAADLHLAAAFIPVFILISALAGCSEEDCINCVELPAPVVPTGVETISQDGMVIVQWIEITYEPYDGSYTDILAGYRIFRRDYAEGDEDNELRTFDPIGFVAWDENYDPYSGYYYYDDYTVTNGRRYEYAVASVNAAGQESALSFEFLIDAPLPMSVAPEELFDAASSSPELAALSGFDFSRLESGRMDPAATGTTADIRVAFDNGVPYVETVRQQVKLLDDGVYTYDDGSLFFEGVSVAPWDGWSASDRLELVVGHIYIVEIVEPAGDPQYPSELHYAKFGVVASGPQSVRIQWAYQTVAGLPELSAPRPVLSVAPRPLVLEF